MRTKKFWWLNLVLALVLALGMFTIGCEEDAEDDDPADTSNPAPEAFQSRWHTVAVQVEGETDLTPLEGSTYLNITEYESCYLYVNFTTEVANGSLSWETRTGNDHMILKDTDRSLELDIEVANVSDNLVTFIIPVEVEGAIRHDSYHMVRNGSRVAGAVLKSSDDTPLEGATVTRTYLDDTATTTTNAQGLYEFSDLMAVSYLIEVSIEGYTSWSKVISSDASHLEYADFNLDEEGSATTGTITGLVNDATTSMQPEVPVTISTDDGMQVVSTDGIYSLSNVENGTRTLTAVAEGYQIFTATVTVDGGTVVQNISLIPGETGGEGTISGIVTDSQTGDALEGVTVTSGSVSTTSDADGNYTMVVPTGLLIVTASMTDYYDNSTEIAVGPDQTVTQNFVMSPVFTTGEGAFRFVLSWGESPGDLDAHLKTPEINGTEYHISYMNTGSETAAPFATLDRDDTYQYGPETITVYQSFEGSYRFFVQNYSSSSQFNDCGARVQIYDDNGVVGDIVIPATGDGNYWNVCSVDGTTGAVTVINEIQDIAPEFIETSELSEKLK
jgi:Carboxypeptidase regulatory-like domain